MWTYDELTELKASLDHVTLEEICTTEEIAVIGENSTRLTNLNTGLTVPKDHSKYSMIVVKQIWKDQKLHDWVCELSLITHLSIIASKNW